MTRRSSSIGDLAAAVVGVLLAATLATGCSSGDPDRAERDAPETGDTSGITDPPAPVAEDLEGALVCARVEAALRAAETGDDAAAGEELATARDLLETAGAALSEAGATLVPQTLNDPDNQERAFDFLDVCATTGYEPLVTRPSG